MRPIDADTLVKTFENMGLSKYGFVERIYPDCVFAVIEKAPTIEAEPVRHGKWEEIRNAFGELEGWLCKCGCESKTKSKYCPHCGAKMDLED